MGKHFQICQGNFFRFVGENFQICPGKFIYLSLTTTTNSISSETSSSISDYLKDPVPLKHLVKLRKSSQTSESVQTQTKTWLPIDIHVFGVSAPVLCMRKVLVRSVQVMHKCGHSNQKVTKKVKKWWKIAMAIFEP